MIETLTFKAGGTLTIECKQTLEDLGKGVFRGTDKWKVIGGTGRFSGAKGSGTGVTNVDLIAGTFDKVLSGTITY